MEEVKNTCIFARLGEHGNQTLIYSMSMNARADVAMVLPIPVKPCTDEDGLRFGWFAIFRFLGLQRRVHAFESMFPE